MKARPLARALVALFSSAALLAVTAGPAGAVTAVKKPKLGRTFVVSLVSGTVTVKKPGSARASRLSRKRSVIPVGSTVNATKGKVRLVGAVKRSGGKQAGVFRAGAFRATQARRDRAVIDLKLVGGDFSGCSAAASGNGYAAARRRIRRLYGKAKGNFRTSGTQSAATVRGTKWLTEDKCDSTLVASEEGTVSVNTGGIKRKVIAGTVFESTISQELFPGYVAFYYAGINYELPGRGVFRYGPYGYVGYFYGLEMFKDSRATHGDVCITRVDGGQERCTTKAFEALSSVDPHCTMRSESTCLYAMDDQCDPESGPGAYDVRLRVNGIDFPPVFRVHAPKPDPHWLHSPVPGEGGQWPHTYREPGNWCLFMKDRSAFP